MGLRPSDTEMQRRIAELLRTPKAGRAVAGQLNDQAEAWAQRAVIGDMRARRLEAARDQGDAAHDLVGADSRPDRAANHVH